MERNGIAGVFNVNRSVTGLVGVARQLRLPSQQTFPRLDARVIRPVAVQAGGVLAAGSLPEMVSDLIDESAVYAVENVKRERFGRRESRS